MATLIETKNLKKHFKTSKGFLHAVDGVDIKIEEGKTLGVVGESGCGKSTLGRLMTKLLPATSGQVIYDGKDIVKANRRQIKTVRSDIQMIFQDPYSSLDPRMTVSELIGEPLNVAGGFRNRKATQQKIFELMNTVGLSPNLVNSYPHELDGGRRQRIGVARALALDPKFVVCDEPVSALDVSIQAQILNLMMDIQEKMGLTYMFITHNLSVVKHISDDIVVMYLGQCVEKSSSEELFKNPLHPYTKALLSAIPVASTSYIRKDSDIIQGEITSPINPAPGCRFAARCPLAEKKCTERDIPLKEVAPGHFVACSLF